MYGDHAGRKGECTDSDRVKTAGWSQTRKNIELTSRHCRAVCGLSTSPDHHSH